MATTQYSCLENSMDRGAWWATVHGVAESDVTEWLTHTQKHHVNGQKWLTILIYNWVKLREWVYVFVSINLWICMGRERFRWSQWGKFSSVQWLSHVQLCDPWTAECQASLSITNSLSPPKTISIESVYFHFYWTVVVLNSVVLVSAVIGKGISYMYIWMSTQLLSHVPLFATPWTIAHQAPLSMEFSRQE